MTTEEELQIFCRNIYCFRVAKGLSQKEMARLLDISVYSLRKIEAGIIPARLTIDVIFQASNLLEIKAHYLFIPLYENRS